MSSDHDDHKSSGKLDLNHYYYHQTSKKCLEAGFTLIILGIRISHVIWDELTARSYQRRHDVTTTGRTTLDHSFENDTGVQVLGFFSNNFALRESTLTEQNLYQTSVKWQQP